MLEEELTLKLKLKNEQIDKYANLIDSQSICINLGG